VSLLALPEARTLSVLSPDGRLLFASRVTRMFAYGLVSVVLVLYLVQVGLGEREVGLLLSLTLVGDAAVSLWITTNADRIGRRRMLLAGSGLLVAAGLVFATSGSIILLTLAAVIGTISPSGNEVGPCQSIEQAALPQTAPNEYRTSVFAWYNLAGYVATAAGALIGGTAAQAMQMAGWSPLDSYRAIVVVYGLLGLVLAVLFAQLSLDVEAAHRTGSSPSSPSASRGGRLGLHRSRGIVMRLAGLFVVDSFAGGLVVQSLIAYWFHLRFGVEPGVLGVIFFGANLFAGFSALAAARVAGRIGLVNTMVFTHLPSNVFLILVPLMPTLPLAIAMLLARFSISQMDVPTRQSYITAVVDPDERSAALGVTTIARTAASSLAPAITGVLLSASLLSVPFLVAGLMKIAYDLALWRSFRALKPPEET
jgi:MFS family permease